MHVPERLDLSEVASNRLDKSLERAGTVFQENIP